MSRAPLPWQHAYREVFQIMDRPDPERVDEEFDIHEHIEEMSDEEYDDWDPADEMNLSRGSTIGVPGDDSDISTVQSIRFGEASLTDPLTPGGRSWEVNVTELYEQWRQGDLIPKKLEPAPA